MTAPSADAIALAAISTKLDDLTTRFDMRFAKGREQAQIIADLQTRLTRAERAAAATAATPLVEGLALVLERLRQGEPTAELVASIASELEYVLESVVGVVTISAEPGDVVDRLRHEVTAASGAGPILRVAALVRVGYEKDGVVLRPARVTAVRVAAAEARVDAGGDR